MKGTTFRFAFCALTAAMLFSATAWANTTTNPKAHGSILRWPAENLSGQIDMVLPDQHLIVVKDQSGTTFDLVVTHATRIIEDGSRVSLSALQSKLNGQVEVHYVPASTGDIAGTIRLGQ